MDIINGKPYFGKVELNKAYVADANVIIPKLHQKVDRIFTDPPYGTGFDFDHAKRGRSNNTYDGIEGDDRPFDPRPLVLAARKGSIVWGYDYFPDKLPVVGMEAVCFCARSICRKEFKAIVGEDLLLVMEKTPVVCPRCKMSDRLTIKTGKVVSTGSLIVWDKKCANLWNDNSDIEIAWVSKPGARRMFRHEWNGACRASERDMFVHPTQKPAILGRHMVETWSEPGDFIVDPFCGSGFVALGCEMVGNRYWLAFDLNPKYVELTNKRVEALRRGVDFNEVDSGQQGLFPS